MQPLDKKFAFMSSGHVSFRLSYHSSGTFFSAPFPSRRRHGGPVLPWSCDFPGWEPAMQGGRSGPVRHGERDKGRAVA